jgi:hypothetical protein
MHKAASVAALIVLVIVTVVVNPRISLQTGYLSIKIFGQKRKERNIPLNPHRHHPPISLHQEQEQQRTPEH